MKRIRTIIICHIFIYIKSVLLMPFIVGELMILTLAGSINYYLATDPTTLDKLMNFDQGLLANLEDIVNGMNMGLVLFSASVFVYLGEALLLRLGYKTTFGLGKQFIIMVILNTMVFGMTFALTINSPDIHVMILVGWLMGIGAGTGMIRTNHKIDKMFSGFFAQPA